MVKKMYGVTVLTLSLFSVSAYSMGRFARVFAAPQVGNLRQMRVQQLPQTRALAAVCHRNRRASADRIATASRPAFSEDSFWNDPQHKIRRQQERQARAQKALNKVA
jgi:hypothetical protein